jgi:hypothetical protein
MYQDFEVEPRAALAEGLLSEQEADSLREEARRLERSPLALLRERGRLSEGTLNIIVWLLLADSGGSTEGALLGLFSLRDDSARAHAARSGGGDVTLTARAVA